MTTMFRTRRTPLRFDGHRRPSSETPRTLRDSPRNPTGRRISAVGSDVVVVTSPPKRTPAPTPPAPPEEEDGSGRAVRKERVRDKHGRYTDGAVTTNQKLVIEIPKRRPSGVNTPMQSSNESPASTIPRPRHRINLRSKGTPKTPLIPPGMAFQMRLIFRLAFTKSFILRSGRHGSPRNPHHVPQISPVARKVPFREFRSAHALGPR